MRAWGVNPRALASADEARTSADAPSLMELEFAAVTEPSLANAGFRFGIFSGRAWLGCSSVSARVSRERLDTQTGTISGLNQPLSMAARDLFSDPMANSSMASRVMLSLSAVR